MQSTAHNDAQAPSAAAGGQFVHRVDNSRLRAPFRRPRLPAYLVVLTCRALRSGHLTRPARALTNRPFEPLAGVNTMGAEPRRRDAVSHPIIISHHEIWRRALEQLRGTLTKGVYDTWFADSRPIEYRGGTLRIGVKNVYQRGTLLEGHYPAIKAAVQQAAGRAINVEVEVFKLDDLPEEPEPADAIERPAEPGEPPPARTLPVLKSDYTFDSFVVGASNQIAHAAAQAVAEAPGEAHNPLFIYSETGLGKTHLLHAIAHETAPRLHTVRVSAATYVRECVRAIRRNERPAFQHKYESVDVLLIDDAQGLVVGKGETGSVLDEFFNTFNALHDGGRQIVLTSDMPPRRLHGLPNRLVSRFEGGLIAEMERPDLETRVAILGKKCAERAIDLDEDALYALAERAPRSVRELQGALGRVLMYASVEHPPAITRPFIAKALEKHVSEHDERKPLVAEDIIEAAAVVFGISNEAFTTKRRDQRSVRARHIAMFLIHEHCGHTFKQIGRAFGGRDHSTALHGCRKIEAELAGVSPASAEYEAETARLVADIRSRLGL